MANTTPRRAFGLVGINSDLEIDPPRFDNLPDFPYAGPYFPPRRAAGGLRCEQYTGDAHADFLQSVLSYVFNAEHPDRIRKWCKLDDVQEENIYEVLWDMREARIRLEMVLENSEMSSVPWDTEKTPQQVSHRGYGMKGLDGQIRLSRLRSGTTAGTMASEESDDSSTSDNTEGVEETALRFRRTSLADPYPAPDQTESTLSPLAPLESTDPPHTETVQSMWTVVRREGRRGRGQPPTLPSRGRRGRPLATNDTQGAQDSVPHGSHRPEQLPLPTPVTPVSEDPMPQGSYEPEELPPLIPGTPISPNPYDFGRTHTTNHNRAHHANRQHRGFGPKIPYRGGAR